MKENIKKYAAECLGTFVLVFISCGTAVFTTSYGAVNVVATALAFGLSVVAMAYTIGHISGCHINPAVSLGAFLNKKLSLKDFLFYMLAQLVGAIFGGLLLFCIVKLMGVDPVGNMGANGYALAENTGKQIVLTAIVEIVLTFIFVLTVLGVTSKKQNAKMAGLVIGLTLTLVHLIGINLTGTSVNPARSIGVALFGGTDALKELWIFILAPFGGAALAGIVGKLLFKADSDNEVQVK